VEGKLEPSWLHVYLYVLWKKLEEKVGSVQKLGDWVSQESVGSTHKQNPHLQGTNEKAGIYMKVFYTGCLQFMILRNYGCVTD
jgi:hypothetical protein